MQTIGERLEDARKRQGLSIRDAAEATKIRSDFLLNFENNKFDFDLPDVYKRGFLRLYAKFLKMDSAKLLRDYQSLSQSTGRASRRESSRETLGRMDLQGRETIMDKLARQTNSAKAAMMEPAEEELELDDVGPSLINRLRDLSINWKIVGIVASTVVIVLFVGVSVNKLVRSDAPAGNPELKSTYALDLAAPEPVEEEIVLRAARGDVHVVVRQELDKKKLYSGTLKRGQQVALQKKGQIKIHFSEGNNLLLEKQGKQYSMNADGIAVRVFD